MRSLASRKSVFVEIASSGQSLDVVRLIIGSFSSQSLFEKTDSEAAVS